MTNQNQLAIVKKDVIDIVSNKIKGFQSNKELHLPANYSPDNAMKSAFLILQNTEDRNKKPVLESCTQNSIANCLLDMVVQGLNPAKKQCYFIAYGKNLTCQRSYHGTVAVVKSLCGAIDVHAQVIWGDDEFEYNIVKGNKEVVSHKQKLGNVGKDAQGGYCIISFPDGKEYTDIMTMDQVKKAWSKSKMDANKSTSTHKQFEEEMIRKTVINRACKKYINTSADNAVLTESFQRAEQISAEAQFEAEVQENANDEMIDITPSNEVEKHDTGSISNELSEAEKAEIIAAEIAESKAENNDDRGPEF